MTAYLPGVRINLLDLINNQKPDEPPIDLEWEPTKAKIDNFLFAIDQYAVAAHQKMNAWSADHVADVRDLKDRKVDIESQISKEREREGEMLATLEKERRTMQELNQSLTHLQSNLSKVREESQQLESELQAIRSEVMTERAEKERQGKTLGAMKSRDEVDLKELQDAIGWKIEGSGQDQLLMRFTLIDPTNPEREFMIVIDISKQDYAVTKISPSLPNLSELLRDLNEDRDFTSFIKRVRKGFKSLCVSNEQGSRLEAMSGANRRKEPAAGGDVEDALGGLTLDPKA